MFFSQADSLHVTPPSPVFPECCLHLSWHTSTRGASSKPPVSVLLLCVPLVSEMGKHEIGCPAICGCCKKKKKKNCKQLWDLCRIQNRNHPCSRRCTNSYNKVLSRRIGKCLLVCYWFKLKSSWVIQWVDWIRGVLLFVIFQTGILLRSSPLSPTESEISQALLFPFCFEE